MSAMENDPRAEAALRRWQELKADRSEEEQDWEDIARLIRPQRGGFMMDDHTSRIREKPLSTAPILAQSTFASELYSTANNPANRWLGLRTPYPELNDFQPMREWLDTAAQRVWASFRPSVSRFYDASLAIYSDIAAFGNGVGYDEMNTAERRIMDLDLSLAEIVWDIDAYGRVTEVVRKSRLRAVEAVRAYGKDNLPARVLELADKGSSDKIAFYHHVQRNDEYTAGRAGPAGKRFVSRVVCDVGKHLVRESGYDAMPFYVARWDVESGRAIGTGPGTIALPAARAVQRMDDATLRAAQFAADPTMMAPDRDTWPLNGRVRPGEVIYGGVDVQGRQLIRPLQQGGGIGLTIDEKRQKIEEIKDAFNWTLLSLAGRTGLNELEVMELQAQRQRLWAPNMGRIQTEYLAPKIERRFAMLWRAGQIPPPPQGIPEGIPLEIEYQSAAAAAQKSSEAASIIRVVNDIAPLAQIKPRLADRIDEDGMIEALTAARGTPPGFLRSREEADAIAEARAQAAQAEQQLTTTERTAGMLRDLAQAAPAGQSQE